MPSKRKMTISELPPKLVALAESDPSTFDQILSEEGIQLVPDAANALIPGKPVGADSPGAALINSDPGYHGALVQRSPRGESVAKKVSKFAQGAIPGVAVGGPLGAVMGGAMNTWLGPEPESPRAFANMTASTVLGPLAGRVRAMLPDGSTAARAGRTIYDIIAGGGETAAADKLGDAMTGTGSNTSTAQYALGGALAKGAGLMLSDTARRAASRMPESLRRKLGSVAQQLAGGTDEAAVNSAAQIEQRAIDEQQRAAKLLDIQRQTSLAAQQREKQAALAAQQQAAQQQSSLLQNSTVKTMLQSQLRGGAQNPTTPGVAANSPNPLMAKPAPQSPIAQQPAQNPLISASEPLSSASSGRPNPLMAEPQPPPQNPLMQPPMVNKQPSTADIQAKAFEDQFANGRQSPVANDDLTAKLQATLALLQKGVPASQIKADVPAVAEKPQFRVRSQADLMDYIKSKGYTDAEASAYLEKRRADAIGEGGWWGRNGVAKDQLDLEFPTRQNPEKGAITIPGDDIKAARKAISEGIDTTRNAIGSAVTGTRNAMGEFFGGGAPPRTANVDPVLAQGSYRDYANSIGKEFGDAVKDPKKAWAPTELDSLIEGKDVTQLPVALQGGSPEFKQAVRTRMTEKLLGAFDGFQKAGDEELSVFDKFHEMRKADLGGGVTGGSVLRATFGNDAVQNIEHLYEALEKSKNLPSQQEKHPFMNIQSLGNALRISIPSAGIGAFFSAHGGVLPATAAAAGAGTVINLGFDKLGQMLGKTNSKFFQFLVDAVEGGSRFTPAMAAQYIAGLKQAADSVTDENGNPIQ